MAKEPFLPLFFGDFLASTAEWKGEERALYMLLLGYQWVSSSKSLPADPRRICAVAGWDWPLFEQCWPVVAGKFPERDGRRANARLEEHRERSKEVSEKRAIAGAKGGATTQAKSKQLLEEAKANASNLLGHPSHPIPDKNSEISSNSESPSLGGTGEVSRKRSTEPRGSRIPDPFMLTAEMRSWAALEAPHVDLEHATREFCDYWRSLPGQRGRKLDWVATWRNRIRECEGMQRSRGNGKARETIDEILARQRREIGETGEPAL